MLNAMRALQKKDYICESINRQVVNRLYKSIHLSEISLHNALKQQSVLVRSIWCITKLK